MKKFSRSLKTRKLNIAIITLLLSLVILPATISAPEAKIVEKSKVSTSATQPTKTNELQVSALNKTGADAQENQELNSNSDISVRKTGVVATDPNETSETKPTAPPTEATEATTKATKATVASTATTSANNNGSVNTTTQFKAQSTVSANKVTAQMNAGYLIAIDNPDSNYVSYKVSLSSADRDVLERLVMGEAGSMSYEGACLVAQAIRDTYVSGNYKSIDSVRTSNGYTGSIQYRANSKVKKAVNFIFDQGGAAVQHRIMYFYAYNICNSSWHETQEYVVTEQNVRFFDKW